MVGAAAAEVMQWLVRAVKMSRGRKDELLPQPADHARLTKTLSEVETLLSDVEIGPKLGEGSFGQVYKGEAIRREICMANLACG